MRKLGYIFIAISVGIGFISSIYPYSRCFYAGIGLAIAVFVSGIWAFMLHNAPEDMGMPTYENPPAPPRIVLSESKKTLGIKQKFINGFYEYDISKFENTYGGA